MKNKRKSELFSKPSNNLTNVDDINNNFSDFNSYLSSIESENPIKTDNDSSNTINLENIYEELSKIINKDNSKSMYRNSPLQDSNKNSLSQVFSNKTNDNLCEKSSSINSRIYNENSFTEITAVPGFDFDNPQNARQNNYAWSFADFNGFIYVGTGRNLTYSSIVMGMPEISVPLDYTPTTLDMGTEIWRYKKDGSLPWERVYKSPIDKTTNKPKYIGIRCITKFESFNIKTALYAAAYSISGIMILKSTNGVDWFEIPTNIDKGTSSRSMMVYNKKLYLTVMVDGAELPSLLYSSEDPELYGWTLETPVGEEGKNPVGAIWSLASFNDHLYVGTTSKNGFNIWRTKGRYPKVNDWKLVIDNGAGDSTNTIPISFVTFKDHLYVGTAYDTANFVNYIIPKGAEIISIDKNDNWKIIVGGPAVNPIETKTGTRNKPLSGFNNGFNNPYNIYMWQMKVYKDKLFVGTYDSSSVIEPTLELILKNKEYLSKMIGKEVVEKYIQLLKSQISILALAKDRLGFDFYVSDDGINYKLISNNGFSNPLNYGIRNIFISQDDQMYIGTANPFTGCQVYKLKQKKSCY